MRMGIPRCSPESEATKENNEYSFSGADQYTADDDFAEGSINEHLVTLKAVYSVGNGVTASAEPNNGGTL
jgi:hypothetical protein